MPQPGVQQTESPRMENKPPLESLFEDEEGFLLGFAYGFVRRREIAEELVQEAFLRLHKHWREVENPRPWIYRAVRNLCLSWLRDNKRETQMDESDEHARIPDTRTPRPDEAVGKLEASGMVRLFLAELKENDRELIRLKYTEDLKYADIAERTGLSVSNVGYRLHHLLRGLASSLQQVGVTGSAG